MSFLPLFLITAFYTTTLFSHPDCTALFVTDYKTGIQHDNPTLKRDTCSCPCSYAQYTDGTCSKCGHKKMPLQSKGMVNITLITQE